MALLTGGEGWHNNHHAHPVSACHGMAWYEIDFNYMGIRLLQLLGLARNVHALNAKTALAKSRIVQRSMRSKFQTNAWRIPNLHWPIRNLTHFPPRRSSYGRRGSCFMVDNSGF